MIEREREKAREIESRCLLTVLFFLRTPSCNDPGTSPPDVEERWGDIPIGVIRVMGVIRVILGYDGHEGYDGY